MNSEARNGFYFEIILWFDWQTKLSSTSSNLWCHQLFIVQSSCGDRWRLAEVSLIWFVTLLTLSDLDYRLALATEQSTLFWLAHLPVLVSMSTIESLWAIFQTIDDSITQLTSLLSSIWVQYCWFRFWRIYFPNVPFSEVFLRLLLHTVCFIVVRIYSTWSRENPSRLWRESQSVLALTATTISVNKWIDDFLGDDLLWIYIKD